MIKEKHEECIGFQTLINIKDINYLINFTDLSVQKLVLKHVQLDGMEAESVIPHWFGAILTYPWSPHEAPQEFLTRKYSCPLSVPYPTARTPWSSFLPHPWVMTPVVYIWKTNWSASMATETGPLARAALSWAP